MDGACSQLCKGRLFQRYIQILNSHTAWKEKYLDPYVTTRKTISYGGLKQKSVVRKAKEIFAKACVSARLGQWVRKPIDQDYFEIPAV